MISTEESRRALGYKVIVKTESETFAFGYPQRTLETEDEAVRFSNKILEGGLERDVRGNLVRVAKGYVVSIMISKVGERVR